MPSECGKRVSQIVVSVWPCPSPMEPVPHSPQASRVSTAASSKGDGKKALAACDSWWFIKESSAWPVPSSAPRISSGMCGVGRDQPLELDERLLVEHDVIDVAALEAARPQAVLDRPDRQAGIALPAG